MLARSWRTERAQNVQDLEYWTERDELRFRIFRNGSAAGAVTCRPKNKCYQGLEEPSAATNGLELALKSEPCRNGCSKQHRKDNVGR